MLVERQAGPDAARRLEAADRGPRRGAQGGGGRSRCDDGTDSRLRRAERAGIPRRARPAAGLQRAPDRPRSAHGARSRRRRSDDRHGRARDAGDPAARRAAPYIGGAQTLTVTSTGYSIRGRTATGLPTGCGVVAVDPSVIPLGTRMTIPGLRRGRRRRHRRRGPGHRRSTSGSRRWREALAWGRRTVTITLHGSRLAPVRAAGGDDARRRRCETSEHSPRRAPRPARRRPRPLPDRASQPARGAGRPDRRRGRGRRRRRSSIVRELAPDVVVMDLNMPGMTRRRGDAPDHDDRAADARRRADDLRPGQRRDGRDPRRRLRLPAQGLVDPGADGRASAPRRSASR